MWERVLTKVLRMATGQSLNVSIRRSRCGDPMAHVYGRDRIGTLLCRLLASILIFAVPLTTLAQDNAVSGEPLSRDILASESADNIAQIDVRIDSGLLSLHSRDAPLAEVLAEISRQAGIELVVEVELGYPVSKSFSNEPLARALQRLLSGTNYIMVYGPSGDAVSPPYPVALRIYGISSGARSSAGAPAYEGGVDLSQEAAIARRAVTLNLGPIPDRISGLFEDLAELDRDQRRYAMEGLAELGDFAAVEVLRHFLALDPDPAVRGEAALALRSIGGEAASEALELGLGDVDPDVRFQVVEAIGEAAGFRATLALGQVFFGETDPQIRMSAIAGLSQTRSEAALAFLEAAAQDPHEQVRDYANYILVTRE